MNVMLSINQVGASKKGAEASFIFRTQNSSNKVTKALFSVSGGASTTTICPSKNIYHDDKNLKGSMCMYYLCMYYVLGVERTENFQFDSIRINQFRLIFDSIFFRLIIWQVSIRLDLLISSFDSTRFFIEIDSWPYSDL